MSKPTTDADDESENNAETTAVEAAEVVTPETVDDDADSEYDSPAERMKHALPDRLHRDFSVAEDDHPLVVTAGSKEALISDTPVQVQQILADGLYEDTGVFFREWLQNHVAAITREAKRLVTLAYGESALYHEVDHSHPEIDGERTIRLPKKAAEIIDMARDLGYAPSIEFTVDHDNGSLTTRDNGIAMTTGEAIELWNEPAASGSGVDLSSAGNKGIGSLTWVSIAGEEGAMKVKTRTRREESQSGEVVPQRDRDGYTFYSYFGGMIPIPSQIDDGFFGTEFTIPVQDSANTETFMSDMERYTDILPTQVSWQDVKSGSKNEEEFDRTTFLDQYDEEPAIVIDRPGEFTLVLDTPDIVSKSSMTNDTYLLDNPIDRNLSYLQSIDTLWNDHLQIHNEQGLIAAGPNRGYLASQIDELAGEIDDIADQSKPMPDVPLPVPVASRDNFKQDEAHKRFFEYLDHIAREEELSTVSDHLNGVLTADTPDDALAFIRESGTQHELYRKLLKKHASSRTLPNRKPLARWCTSRPDIDFDLDDAPTVDPGEPSISDPMKENTSGETERDDRAHPQWENLCLLARMENTVDVATSDMRGDPDKKDNRRNSVCLGTLLAKEGRWPLFVGTTINRDRAKVIWHNENYPNAALIKTRNYSNWQGVLVAALVKDTPMTHDDTSLDDDWTVPQHIHDKRKRSNASTKTTTTNEDGDEVEIDLTDPDNFQERPVDIRCKPNASIDYKFTVGDLMEGLNDMEDSDDVSIGVNGTDLGQHDIVLFSSTREENISDHYDLSEHAAIIKCIKMEAEALHAYDNVYYLDEFEEMITSTKLPVYDPFSQAGFDSTIETILDDRDSHVFVHKESDALWAAIRGKQIEDVSPSHEMYAEIRQRTLDEFINGISGIPNFREMDAEDVPDDLDTWRAVEWDTQWTVKRDRIKTYIHMFYDRPESLSLRSDVIKVHYRNYDSSRPEKTAEIRRSTVRGLDRIVKRTQYPQWDNDSDIWDRIETGYNGPKDYEKELLMACRDLGIDPTDTENLRQAIVMLSTTCPDDGGDD